MRSVVSVVLSLSSLLSPLLIPAAMASVEQRSISQEVTVTTTPNSRIRKIELSGSAAEAVFIALKQTHTDTKVVEDNLVRVKRKGQNISCTALSGNGTTHTCKLFVDRDASDPHPEPSFTPSPLPTVVWKSKAKVREQKSGSVVSFTGDGANAIYNFLPVQIPISGNQAQAGPSETRILNGILCKPESPQSTDIRCTFKIDPSGKIKPQI